MNHNDALLNELHETNVEILKRNKASGAFSDTGRAPTAKPRPDPIPPTETDLDALSILSTSSPSESAKAFHDTPHTDSAGMQYDWGAILDTLDPSDYAGMSNGYSYPPNESASTSTKSPLPPNSATHNGNGHSSEVSSPVALEEQSKETRRAAEQAAQQLDDLLISLGQLKMENSQSNQKRTTLDQTDSDTLAGTDIFPDTRDSNSAVYYNSNASSTACRAQPVDGTRLHRQDARRNGTPVTAATSESGYTATPSEPTHVLSTMLSNLSSELAQKGAITSTKGVCHACRKPIVGMLISAMDKEWHPDHFTCANCGIGLVRVDFYERDENPYCLECHARLFSPKCGYCGEAILEKCIVALSRTWHPEHFFCYGCQRAFNGSVTVHEHEDKVYCPACYLDRFGTHCQGCNQPITDSYITALNAPWHRNCFACQECAKPLSGTNFHDVDGYPLCESHYYTRRGLICNTCAKPITGRCVNALGKRYHPLHFVCAYCLQPLQSGTFKEHTNKPYCHQCFLQLFG